MHLYKQQRIFFYKWIKLKNTIIFYLGIYSLIIDHYSDNGITLFLQSLHKIWIKCYIKLIHTLKYWGLAHQVACSTYNPYNTIMRFTDVNSTIYGAKRLQLEKKLPCFIHDNCEKRGVVTRMLSDIVLPYESRKLIQSRSGLNLAGSIYQDHKNKTD